MSLKKQFGANLRHYRKGRELTQEELAHAVGLSVDMIGRIERGALAPSFATIEKIATVFGVDEAALFSIGVATFPKGERGQLLRRINAQLAKLNDDDLAKASKMIAVLGN